MEQQNLNTPASAVPPVSEANSPLYSPAQPLSPKFSIADGIFGWICLVLGFIFTRYAVTYAGGIYGGIFWALTGAAAAVYTALRKLPVSRRHIVVFGIMELFCFVPFFCSNGFVNFLASCFSYLLLFYLAASVSGAELFGKRFAADILGSVLARPFADYDKAPRAAFSLFRGGRSKNLLFVLAGLAAAVPLTIVVVCLLMSSDAVFEGTMNKLFSNLPVISGSIIWQLFFGILVGMYLFGMMFAAGKRREPLPKRVPSYRILPAPLAYTAVTPICVFYVVYLKIITEQLISFSPASASPVSYSSFARRGFFELCVVAVINLGVILFMQGLVRRNEGDKKPAALKVYITVIASLTLLIIATAFSKMLLYITEMGMTPLRIYTSWFMLVLAVAFILIIVLQYKDISFWKVMFGAFTVMFGVLCFGNVDGMIASYNVSAFMDGKTQTLDYDVLIDCSVAAIKPLERLCDDEEFCQTRPYGNGMALNTMRTICEDMNPSPAYFSIQRLDAERAAEKYGFGE